jgi:hypothetical protein
MQDDTITTQQTARLTVNASARKPPHLRSPNINRRSSGFSADC